jgi:hypothetical protein
LIDLAGSILGGYLQGAPAAGRFDESIRSSEIGAPRPLAKRRLALAFNAFSK